MLIIIVIFLILIFLYFNFEKIRYNCYKKCIILNGVIKKYKVNYDEIFPLKKYNFYNINLLGPNKTNYLFNKLYNKSNKYDVMRYKYIRYSGYHLLEKDDFKPANLEKKNYKKYLCNSNTERCEFWKEKNYKIPPCCASNLFELLVFIKDLLLKHNIEYFIYWGTLLGAVRHNGIIPWDSDIDIYINYKDVSKLKKMMKHIHETTHYEIEFKSVIRLNYSKKNKSHIDIFTYKIL
jgi:hypothetical protein